MASPDQEALKKIRAIQAERKAAEPQVEQDDFTRAIQAIEATPVVPRQKAAKAAAPPAPKVTAPPKAVEPVTVEAPKFELPPDIRREVNYRQFYDAAIDPTLNETLASLKREFGVDPKEFQRIAEAQGVSLQSIYDARRKGRTFDEIARANRERGVLGFMPVAEREAAFRRTAEAAEKAMRGEAADTITIKKSGADTSTLGYILGGTQAELPEVSKPGEHGYTLSSLLIDSLKRDDNATKLYDLYGRQVATGATQKYVDARTDELAKRAGVTVASPNSAERYAKLRRQALNEVIAYKTVGQWTPAVTLQDVEVTEGNAPPGIFGALKPNIELIGFNNQNQAIFRQESPLGVLFRAIDIPQAAVVGALEGSASRGVQTGANFLEYALDNTEGASPYLRYPAVGAGFVASVVMPDSLLVGGLAFKGTKAAVRTARFHVVKKEAVGLLKTIAEARKANDFQRAVEAESRLRRLLPTVADDLDRYDAEAAKALTLINPENAVIFDEDMTALIGGGPGEMSDLVAREAYARVWQHPSMRKEVLSAKLKARDVPSTTYAELYDTARQKERVVAAKADYVRNAPRSMDEYAQRYARGAAKDVVAGLLSRAAMGANISVPRLSAQDVDAIAEIVAQQAPKFMSDKQAFYTDLRAALKAHPRFGGDEFKLVRQALHVPGKSRLSAQMERKLVPLIGKTVEEVQAPDLALFDRALTAVEQNNEARGMAAALLFEEVANRGKIRVEPLKIFDEVLPRDEAGNPLRLSPGASLYLHQVRRLMPDTPLSELIQAVTIKDQAVINAARKQKRDPFDLWRELFGDIRRGTDADLRRIVGAPPAPPTPPAPAAPTPPVSAAPAAPTTPAAPAPSLAATRLVNLTPSIPSGTPVIDVATVADARALLDKSITEVNPLVQFSEAGTGGLPGARGVILGDVRVVADIVKPTDPVRIIVKVGSAPVKSVLAPAGTKFGAALRLGFAEAEKLMEARVARGEPAIKGTPDIRPPATAAPATAAVPTPAPAAPAPAAAAPTPGVLPVLADTVEARKEQLRAYLRANPGTKVKPLFGQFKLTPGDVKKIHAEVKAERAAAAAPAPAAPQAPEVVPAPKAAEAPTPEAPKAVAPTPEVAELDAEIARLSDERDIALESDDLVEADAIDRQMDTLIQRRSKAEAAVEAPVTPTPEVAPPAAPTPITAAAEAPVEAEKIVEAAAEAAPAALKSPDVTWAAYFRKTVKPEQPSDALRAVSKRIIDLYDDIDFMREWQIKDATLSVTGKTPDEILAAPPAERDALLEMLEAETGWTEFDLEDFVDPSAFIGLTRNEALEMGAFPKGTKASDLTPQILDDLTNRLIEIAGEVGGPEGLEPELREVGGDLVESLADVRYDAKELQDRIVPIEKDAAFDFVRKTHSKLPDPRPQGLLASVGVAAGGDLRVVGLLNTPSAPFKDTDGVVELSRVASDGKLKGGSSAITYWAMQNLQRFNRSGDPAKARLVTTSLLTERGEVYSALEPQGLHPTSLVVPSEGTGSRKGAKGTAQKGEWKINWEFGPAAAPEAPHLYHIQPVYRDVVVEGKKLSVKRLNSLIQREGTDLVAAYKDAARVLGVSSDELPMKAAETVSTASPAGRRLLAEDLRHMLLEKFNSKAVADADRKEQAKLLDKALKAEAPAAVIEAPKAEAAPKTYYTKYEAPTLSQVQTNLSEMRAQELSSGRAARGERPADLEKWDPDSSEFYADWALRSIAYDLARIDAQGLKVPPDIMDDTHRALADAQEAKAEVARLSDEEAATQGLTYGELAQIAPPSSALDQAIMRELRAETAVNDIRNGAAGGAAAEPRFTVVNARAVPGVRTKLLHPEYDKYIIVDNWKGRAAPGRAHADFLGVQRPETPYIGFKTKAEGERFVQQQVAEEAIRRATKIEPPQAVAEPLTPAAVEAATTSTPQVEAALISTETAPSRIQMAAKQTNVRNPELVAMAKAVQEGKATREQYEALVNRLRPITPYKQLPAPTPEAQMQSALKSNQKKKIGAPRQIAEGTPVGLRVDIPALQDHGAWVVTVHEKRKSKSPRSLAGSVVGYDNVAAVRNAEFVVPSENSILIASGTDNKMPYATIEGAWVPQTTEEAVARAQAAFNDPAWVQVGQDPLRHAYFYDRTTTQPIVAAEEVIQVGPLVLAKNPTYAPKEKFLYQLGPAGEVKGLVETVNDGKNIIYLFQGADVSTLLHEGAHIIRKRLLDAEDMENITQWIKGRGVNVGHEFGDFTGDADEIEKAEELFAQAFERYIMDGEAPTPGLRDAFEQLKQTMIAIYRNITSPVSGVTVTPEAKAVFDKLLAESPETSFPSLQKLLRRELLGKADEETDFIQRLSQEAQRRGIPRTALEDLGRQFDTAKKNGVDPTKPYISFPVPVLGKKDWSFEALAKAQQKIDEERINLIAKKRGMGMNLLARSSKDAALVEEDSPVESLRSALSARPDEAGLPAMARTALRSVAATMFGGDVVREKGVRLMPPEMRKALDTVDRRIEESIGDTVTLLNDALESGNPKALEAFLSGEAAVTRAGGRPIVSAGHDYMASFQRMIARAFDNLNDAEREALHELADILQRPNWQEKLPRIGFNPDGSSFERASAKAVQTREAMSSAIMKLLYKSGSAKDELGIGLAQAISRAVEATDTPRPTHEFKLVELMTYIAGRTGRGLTDTGMRKMFEGTSNEAVRAFLNGAGDLYDEASKRRLAVVIGGYGAADLAKLTLVKLNLGISEAAKTAFTNWIVGESWPAQYTEEIQRIVNRYGLNPDFVSDTVLGVDYYIPKQARERMASALARVNYRPAEAATGVDAFNNLYRYMKARMTRGTFFLRQRYYMMNTVDHFIQMAMTVGFGPAANSVTRVIAQDLMVLPFWQQLLDAARKLPGGQRIPRDVLERARRSLQARGDVIGNRIGQLFGVGKYRIEVNPILEGLDGGFRAGGRIYTYREIRNIAVEEGIFASFDTRQLARAVQREGSLYVNQELARWGERSTGSLDQARRGDIITGRVRNFVADWEQTVGDTAEAWGERERLGAMVALMEAGHDPRTAARLTIDALYDYSQSMTKADRSIIVGIMFPFWAFQKNANAQVFNLMFSPWGAYRMMAIRRARERSADLLTAILYGEVSGEYELDVESMPPELQDSYYALITEFESAYDGDPPEEAKRAMRLLLTGRGMGVEEGRYFQMSPELLRMRGEGLFADLQKFAPYAQLRPSRASRMGYLYERAGFAVRFPRTEAVQLYYSLLGDDHAYMEVFLPESSVEGGLRHITQMLATFLVMGSTAPDILSAGALTEGGLREVKAMRVLEPVFDPERSPILGPLLADMSSDAMPPKRLAPLFSATATGAQQVATKIHPFIGKLIDDLYGTTLLRTPADIDPFVVYEQNLRQLTPEQQERIRAIQREYPDAGKLRDQRYYIPGGVWSMAFENTPFLGELNALLLRYEQEPLERMNLRGKILRAARGALGIDISMTSPAKAVKFEEPTKLRETKGL